MDFVSGLTQTLCKPLLLYIVFVCALILYDVTQGDARAVLKNTIFLIFGSLLIYALCNAGFETAAWILLALPPFFFIAILAMLILSQIMKTTVVDDSGTSTMSNWSSWFGGKSQEQSALENVERDVEKALEATASTCGEPVKNIQMWKMTPISVQSVACPSCSATSTSS